MDNGWRKVSNTIQEMARGIRAESSRGADDNRRRHGRVRPGFLQCNLGKVLDLSASGLRIGRNKPIEGNCDVLLKASDRSVAVRAEVVWTKKNGFRNFEVGLRFIDVSTEHAKVLRAMAVYQ